MRRILATLAVVGALLYSAGSAWADWDGAVAAHQRGDYATAFREALPTAILAAPLAVGGKGNAYFA